MEEEIENQIGEREAQQTSQPVQELVIPATAEISPLNIIRTETVMSRLPIHNLSKKGRVNIQIVRKTEKGEIDLKWEVSYSDRYGQPRQIAYKLDTIVVNRKIDELSRPLPELVRLGSLREIAEQLGLGGDTNNVRTALRQNASAFITAKFKYKGNDGSERNLEADFTRYSVIFTGEKLPNERRADAVYILLNPPYREVLNSAPVRPLDYDYLKELPPAAQRFYEIVSRKIFAALKYDHPHAKISYSEFCTFSAQTRQIDYDHFKKQMYKVHRPHIKSGYIAAVEFQVCTDEEGKPDWLMVYTPGEKARAEYKTFNVLPQARRSRQRKLGTRSKPNSASAELPNITPATKPTQTPESPAQGREVVDPEILSALNDRGIYAPAKLLEAKSPDALEAVWDYIEYWDRIPAEKKTAGLLRSLIQSGEPLPATFETRKQRRARQAAAERTRKLSLLKDQLTNAYADHRQAVIDKLISEQISPEELERRVAERKVSDSQQKGLWNTSISPELAHRLARRAVQDEIAANVNIITFEEFRRRELPRLLAELQLDAAELGTEIPATATPNENTV